MQLDRFDVYLVFFSVSTRWTFTVFLRCLSTRKNYFANASNSSLTFFIPFLAFSSHRNADKNTKKVHFATTNDTNTQCESTKTPCVHDRTNLEEIWAPTRSTTWRFLTATANVWRNSKNTRANNAWQWHPKTTPKDDAKSVAKLCLIEV